MKMLCYKEDGKSTDFAGILLRNFRSEVRSAENEDEKRKYFSTYDENLCMKSEEK